MDCAPTVRLTCSGQAPLTVGLSCAESRPVPHRVRQGQRGRTERARSFIWLGNHRAASGKELAHRSGTRAGQQLSPATNHRKASLGFDPNPVTIRLKISPPGVPLLPD